MPRRDLVRDVRLALADHPQGAELASLLTTAHEQAKRAEARLAEVEAEAWALSYIVGEVLDGQSPNEIVDDLPSDARRRVIAVRHGTGPYSFIKPSDQYGPLPRPPARSSVMRTRVRVVDVDMPEEWDYSQRGPRTIEGRIAPPNDGM